jgi:serine/threonine protein kinase
MNCSSCAAELTPQATICSTCGRLVEDPLVGKLINDRYRIQAKLAAGGFGSIYRALGVVNNRKVAIKVMHRELSSDPQLAARFRREAVTLCSLRDAHTVTMYEFDQTADGRLFIVMELLEGRNLLELFRASGPLPWRRMLAIARAVCSALAEAHALGIVHRDLKPANIFLEERRGGGDGVKVLDFGIAKIMHGSDIDDGSELTYTGQAVGTLEYMAPEQLVGGKCDGRTDMYTLGVVAYEMIVGRRPFGSVNVMDLLATQLAQKAPKPSLYVPLPTAVTEILLRCLERDAPDRHADVNELAAAIDEVLAQSDMELLQTRTSTTRGHLAPRQRATGPIAHLTPVPHIQPSPAFGFEAPSARSRLVENPGASQPALPASKASQPALPAPKASQPVIPPSRASYPVMPAPFGHAPPMAHPGVPTPLTPLPIRPLPPPAPGPPPRTSMVRILLLMLVLAAVGVGAGILISELGL